MLLHVCKDQDNCRRFWGFLLHVVKNPITDGSYRTGNILSSFNAIHPSMRTECYDSTQYGDNMTLCSCLGACEGEQVHIDRAKSISQVWRFDGLFAGLKQNHSLESLHYATNSITIKTQHFTKLNKFPMCAGT